MKTVDTTPNLVSPNRSDTHANPTMPAQRSPSLAPCAGELLKERAELAFEIADELAAGEWVPPLTIHRYQSVKRRLKNFQKQANANRSERGHLGGGPITATGVATAPVERVANREDGAE